MQYEKVKTTYKNIKTPIKKVKNIIEELKNSFNLQLIFLIVISVYFLLLY